MTQFGNPRMDADNQRSTSKIRDIAFALGFGVVGWALCGAVVGIGSQFLTMNTTLIIHAAAVPLIFGSLSLLLLKKFAATSPFQTALIFLSVVVTLDFFVVALLIEGNFEMFRSSIGTWIPFVLIFVTTYTCGVLCSGRIMTNSWNRFIYAMWSPIYDRLVNISPLASSRRRAFEVAQMQSGEHVLLVGVGSGADFQHIPEGTSAVGIDISPSMLKRGQAKLAGSDHKITLVEGDAQSMPFEDESFDVAILTLILSVVPDGASCLRETTRTLKPGGRVLVFDKFKIHGKQPSFGRRLLNVLTTLFGTDINRDFEEMLGQTGLAKERDEASLFHGAYRIILLRKPFPSEKPVETASNHAKTGEATPVSTPHRAR